MSCTLHAEPVEYYWECTLFPPAGLKLVVPWLIRPKSSCLEAESAVSAALGGGKRVGFYLLVLSRAV